MFCTYFVLVTVTTQEASAPPPSAAFAVMTAVPAEIAVTRPAELTAATDELLVDQPTAPPAGVVEARRIFVLPFDSVTDVGESETLCVFCPDTVTLQEAALPEPISVAVMVETPFESALSCPAEVTETMEGFELFHVTAACAPAALERNAVRVLPSPSSRESAVSDRYKLPLYMLLEESPPTMLSAIEFSNQPGRAVFDLAGSSSTLPPTSSSSFGSVTFTVA